MSRRTPPQGSVARDVSQVRKQASIDETDSPFTTDDEDVIYANSTNGPITVELSTSDLRLGNAVVIVDVGLNASQHNITVQVPSGASEAIDPGGASSKTLDVDGVQLAFEAGTTNWHANLNRLAEESTGTDLQYESVTLDQGADDGTDRIIVKSQDGTERAEIYYDGTDTVINPLTDGVSVPGAVSIDQLVVTEQVNNSALVGSGYYRRKPATTFDSAPSGAGPAEDELGLGQWNVSAGVSLNVKTNDREITGENALHISYDETPENLALELLALPSAYYDSTEHFLNQNITIRVAWTTVTNESQDLKIYDENTPVTQFFWNYDTKSDIFHYRDGGSNVSSGQVVGDETTVQLLISLDFDNQQYDLEGWVGGTKFSDSTLGFQNSVDHMSRLRFEAGSEVTTVTQTHIALDEITLNKPVGLALGDSITSYAGVHGLAADGSENWPSVVNANTSDIIWTRNHEGGAHGEVTWAYDKLDDFMAYTQPSYVILAYGIHSILEDGISKAGWVENYMATVTKARRLGIQPIGWLMNRTTDADFTTQKDWIETLQTRFDDHNIPYVDAWDALDSSPDDGNHDTRDASLYDDATHPNTAGQSALADSVVSTLSDLGIS